MSDSLDDRLVSAEPVTTRDLARLIDAPAEMRGAAASFDVWLGGRPEVQDFLLHQWLEGAG